VVPILYIIYEFSGGIPNTFIRGGGKDDYANGRQYRMDAAACNGSYPTGLMVRGAPKTVRGLSVSQRTRFQVMPECAYDAGTRVILARRGRAILSAVLRRCSRLTRHQGNLADWDPNLNTNPATPLET